jgi:hypothetical protein
MVGLFLTSETKLAKYPVMHLGIFQKGSSNVATSLLCFCHGLVRTKPCTVFDRSTATFGFVRNVSCAMSIVLGGVLFQNGIESHLATIQSTVGSDMARKFAGASAAANVGLIVALPAAQMVVVRAVYADSLRDMWILCTFTAGLGLFASIFIGKQALLALEVQIHGCQIRQREKRWHLVSKGN